MPPVLSTSDGKLENLKKRIKGPNMEKLLLFKVGKHQYGLDMTCVSGIHQLNPTLAEIDQSHYRSIQIVDGRETTLYNIASILGESDADLYNRDSRLIRVSANDHFITFKVDQIDGPANVEDDQLTLLPSIFKERSQACFPYVLSNRGALTLIINPQEIAAIAADLEDSDSQGQNVQSESGAMNDIVTTAGEMEIETADIEDNMDMVTSAEEDDIMEVEAIEAADEGEDEVFIEDIAEELDNEEDAIEDIDDILAAAEGMIFDEDGMEVADDIGEFADEIQITAEDASIEEQDAAEAKVDDIEAIDDILQAAQEFEDDVDVDDIVVTAEDEFDEIEATEEEVDIPSVAIEDRTDSDDGMATADEDADALTEDLETDDDFEDEFDEIETTDEEVDIPSVAIEDETDSDDGMATADEDADALTEDLEIDDDFEDEFDEIETTDENLDIPVDVLEDDTDIDDDIATADEDADALTEDLEIDDDFEDEFDEIETTDENLDIPVDVLEDDTDIEDEFDEIEIAAEEMDIPADTVEDDTNIDDDIITADEDDDALTEDLEADHDFEDELDEIETTAAEVDILADAVEDDTDVDDIGATLEEDTDTITEAPDTDDEIDATERLDAEAVAIEDEVEADNDEIVIAVEEDRNIEEDETGTDDDIGTDAEEVDIVEEAVEDKADENAIVGVDDTDQESEQTESIENIDDASDAPTDADDIIGIEDFDSEEEIDIEVFPEIELLEEDEEDEDQTPERETMLDSAESEAKIGDDAEEQGDDGFDRMISLIKGLDYDAEVNASKDSDGLPKGGAKQGKDVSRKSLLKPTAVKKKPSEAEDLFNAVSLYHAPPDDAVDETTDNKDKGARPKKKKTQRAKKDDDSSAMTQSRRKDAPTEIAPEGSKTDSRESHSEGKKILTKPSETGQDQRQPRVVSKRAESDASTPADTKNKAKHLKERITAFSSTPSLPKTIDEKPITPSLNKADLEGSIVSSTPSEQDVFLQKLNDSLKNVIENKAFDDKLEKVVTQMVKKKMGQKKVGRKLANAFEECILKGVKDFDRPKK